MTVRHVLLLSVALAGCGAEPPGAPPPGSPATVLARAAELAAGHRVVEALAAIEAYASSRPSGVTLATAEIPLWEKRAALLLNASRPREAEEALLELRASGPLDPYRKLLLAECYLQQGAYSKALDAYQDLPPEKLVDELLDYSKATLRSGYTAEGAAAAAAALIRDPWLEEAYLAFGRALARLGKESLAETFLARYHGGEAYRQAMVQVIEFEFRGQRGHALLERARAERQRGRLWEAMHAANQALKEDRELGSAYLELARIALLLERPWDALPQLRKLPPRLDVLSLLAELYERAGDVERARRAYGAALEKEPGRDDLRKRLATLDRGETSTPVGTARQDTRRRIREKPLSECVPELLELSEVLARHDDGFAARSLGLFLVSLKPGDPRTRLSVARLLGRAEDTFLRLWLLAPVADARSEFDRELEGLGLRPDLVRRALKGEAIVEPNE